MDGDANALTPEPTDPAPKPARPRVVVPVEVEPLLAELANARAVTMRHLAKLDRASDALSPEELTRALVHDSTLTLNIVRADRALRQIVVAEMEAMGLREPAIPRGPGGNAAGVSGSGAGGRHDFNDLNDLRDLNDLNDEFEALFDKDDPFDREAYADLEALETHDTFELYERNRKRDPDIRAKLECDMDARILREIEYITARQTAKAAASDGIDIEPRQTPEEHRAAIRQLDEILMEGADEARAIERRNWTQRRNLLIRRRAIEKRLTRHGRGPPDG